MDNLSANKSHIPCQSWADQNGWSTASSQGPLLNSLPNSQHLSMGSSSEQRPSYDHMQASNQSCMINLRTAASRNNTHHPALYKTSPISSNPSPTSLFANTAIPSSSHISPFSQQNPHTSAMLLNPSQGKNISPPSLPQHQPLPSAHDPYETTFQPPLNNQCLPNGLQDLPISQPSCGQREQCQWMPPSHCTGAVKESVPDVPAHPHKKQSQEGNLNSPPAKIERQRSILMNHRAQLLQQVAELDKLLESITSEDDSDGKCPHTSIQTSDPQQVQLSAGKSKSHSQIASDCSSPASYGGQSDTCDSPGEPMSPTDSEKIENASAKSEDGSDPDYLPNNDGDDFLSEPGGASSDESSHSRPSTPTDEKSSLPVKKRAKPGSSLLVDNSVGPPKKIRAANMKISSETVVLASSKSKKGVYDRRNYCLFCSRPLSKMARHLESIHSDKAEVAAAFQYPRKSRERQKIWNRLINQGNFAHNKDVLKSGKGHLAARKRPSITQKAQDFLHCLYCRGLYLKKALPRHMKSCPEKVKNEDETEIGRPRIALRCVLEVVGDLGISDGFKDVLTQMVYDDVTQAIMEDEVILQFGELLFNQHGTDPRKHCYIKQNIRQIARLVLEAKKMTPLQKLVDFFLPSNFPHVVSAVNVLAGYNPENKTYSIPSLAIKLGYNLQTTCGIVESNALKCGDKSLAESAQNFISVYEKEWNKLISSGALTTLRKTKLNTAQKVPLAQDVKLLNSHIEHAHALAEKQHRDSPSAENYAALAKAMLARTILFNRRRAREVALLPLTAFMSRKKSNVLDGMDISVSGLEKNMCKFFSRVDIRGRSGRMVPILFKPSFVSALELLVQTRETCGVPSKNPYLFGRPQTLTAYSGSESIQKYAKACDAKDPEVLTTAKIRQHYAKMLQMINLDENEADQILGPNNKVRSLRQDSDMKLDDGETDTDDLHQEQAHGATKGANRTVLKKSGSKKGSQNSGKQKWEEAEILAVERHMMRLIKDHRVPQKNDCIQCLEAEPEALKTRTWKGVKDYVRNRITALKRQSGARSKKGN